MYCSPTYVSKKKTIKLIVINIQYLTEVSTPLAFL